MSRYLDHWFKLRQLRIVNAVDSQGSITSASRLLGLSQPTLTKSLHDLEKTVGLQLYVRHARGVEPTAAGHAVIRSARRILAELTHLDEELDVVSNRETHHATIGVCPAPAVSLLPHVLANLRATSPDLRVEVTEGELGSLCSALACGSIDLIIGDLYLGGGRDGLLRQVICDDPLVMVARASHPLFQTTPTFELAAKYDLIVPPLTRRFGEEVNKLLLNIPDFRPFVVHSTSMGFAREMVRVTDTIALASRLMMSPDIVQGTCRIIPLDLGSPSVPFGITCRDDSSFSPTMNRFVTGLETTIHALIGADPQSSVLH